MRQSVTRAAGKQRQESGRRRLLKEWKMVRRTTTDDDEAERRRWRASTSDDWWNSYPRYDEAVRLCTPRRPAWTLSAPDGVIVIDATIVIRLQIHIWHNNVSSVSTAWCLVLGRGCADFRAPRNGWVQRSGDRVTITCNFTSHTWHIVCRDTQWVGQISACDEGLCPLFCSAA